MSRFLTYIVVAVAALLVGCFEEESFDTQLVINPFQQIYDGADVTELEGVQGYVFAADTADIDILSYEDALIGRVLSRETGEVIPPLAVSELYAGDGADGSSIAMQVSEEYVTFLLVDTLNEDYAYTYYELGVNLPQLYIYIVFRPWYEGTVSYGNWIYVVPEGNGETDPDEIPTVTE